MSRGEPASLSTLSASHITDLRRIAADPRCHIFPQSMALFRRLGLADWDEPPCAPRNSGGRIKAPPHRAKRLTALGMETIEMAPPEMERKAERREVRGFTYVGELAGSWRFR